ncbi:SET domain-containing protein [Stemphylium lycopersici]|nr:SET domain-containing protein [Stemphylium lycopersici]
MSDEQKTSVATPAPYYISKSNVCVNSKGESVGRGVFTNKRFGAGEEVARFQRPLVGSLETERLLDTCANCYLWTEGASAGTRLYVPEGAEACQKEAWNRGHKHECKVLKPMAGRGLPKAFLASMELLTRRKHGLISDADWQLLCQLPSHIEDFKRNGTYENIELMSMGVGQFSLSQNMFDKDFVAAMYGRVMSNALTLITPTLDPLGIMVDPTLCYLNHSCDPNAYIMMDGPRVSIRTLRPIKKDKEIFISYIDTTHPYHKRQEDLQTRWFFTCRCAKCQDKATRQEDNWLVPLDPDWVPSKDELQIFVDNQETAFAVYEQMQSMDNAEVVVPLLQESLQICHGSTSWPLYRQPYASTRDELVVNLLSLGKFQEAWAQCAKRYKYILPKLYPVPFHPVRVVQTWQMAMLAAYLASTEERVGAPGVNMGLIAMMLVKQVLDVAHLSHGPGNAFTKSVKEKAEEMIEELKRSLGNPDSEIMNRELEVQRDWLMEMGDWAKDGKPHEISLREKAFSAQDALREAS